jgi:hypothetical protein
MSSVARLRLPVALLAVSALLLTGCDRSSTRRPSAGAKGVGRGALRQATPRERSQIATTVSRTWEYEAEPPEPVRYLYHVHLRRPRVRPKVVRLLVSKRDPGYASAVVELRDARGRRRGSAAVVLLAKEEHPVEPGWGYVIAGPALSFPLSCTAATPRAVRDLICPNPWRLLRYPRPRIRAQTQYSQPIPVNDVHRVDWRKVVLPGGACGSSRPIRLHEYRWSPEALVHPDVDMLWWNPVVVSSWSKPVFGDLDGDGRDEAALDIGCANAGGTAAGELGSAGVIFKAFRRSLRVVGIVTPRQPLLPENPHVPLSSVKAIERRKVVVSEGWYGPHDGDCCASGRVRTIWSYRRGRLRPTRTTILQPPWASPLGIYDVLGEPGDQELSSGKLTRVALRPGFRFLVRVDNEGRRTKRNVEVTLRIGRIARTRTIERIIPWQVDPATVFFGDLGRLQLGKRTTVTVEIRDRGTNPLRYPVIFIGLREE